VVVPTLEDFELTWVVAYGMAETQTDPAAWSHVTQIRLLTRPGDHHGGRQVALRATPASL